MNTCSSQHLIIANRIAAGAGSIYDFTDAPQAHAASTVLHDYYLRCDQALIAFVSCNLPKLDLAGVKLASHSIHNSSLAKKRVILKLILAAAHKHALLHCNGATQTLTSPAPMIMQLEPFAGSLKHNQ
jgi:hypothetical protein